MNTSSHVSRRRKSTSSYQQDEFSVNIVNMICNRRWQELATMVARVLKPKHEGIPGLISALVLTSEGKVFQTPPGPEQELELYDDHETYFFIDKVLIFQSLNYTDQTWLKQNRRKLSQIIERSKHELKALTTKRDWNEFYQGNLVPLLFKIFWNRAKNEVLWTASLQITELMMKKWIQDATRRYIEREREFTDFVRKHGLCSRKIKKELKKGK